MSQEEHQFGDGRLRGAVVPADHTGLHQLVTGFVAFHFNGSCAALSDVYDYDTLFAGSVQAAEEPFFTGSIAGTVGFKNNRFQPFGGKHGIHYVLLNAGKEFQHGNVGVQQIMGL